MPLGREVAFESLGMKSSVDEALKEVPNQLENNVALRYGRSLLLPKRKRSLAASRSVFDLRGI